MVERGPYELLFGERKARDGTKLGRPPGDGRKAADLYAQLLAAEPHATAECKRELRTEAVKKARQSPLFFAAECATVTVASSRMQVTPSSVRSASRTPAAFRAAL